MVVSYLKTHYQIHGAGNKQAQESWVNDGLIPYKVKFCDGLMMSKNRAFDFTKDTDGVDCENCRKKIDSYVKNGFDLPY